MEEYVPFSGRLDVEMNNLWSLCQERGWVVPKWIKADPKDVAAKYEDLHEDQIELDERILDDDIFENADEIFSR